MDKGLNTLFDAIYDAMKRLMDNASVQTECLADIRARVIRLDEELRDMRARQG